MHCNRPKVMAPIVLPTKCCNVHDFEKIIVPHVHPSHTTVHHHKMYEHLHTYPHTVSHETDVSHQHFNCGAGPVPGVPGPAPMGPMWPMGPRPMGPFGR